MNLKCPILVLVIIGCVLFLQTGCQEQAKSKSPAEPAKTAPKITFENVVYDFGQVGPNKKHTGQFKFKNTGEALLKISEVTRCCGVVTRLEKKEYQPGESGTLKVEWNSGALPSIFRRQLTIHSNDPKNPQTTLSVTAKVVLKVNWKPKSLRLVLNKENAGCPNITIRSLDNQPFSILKFKSTADCITADYDSSVVATKFILEPKVNIDAMPKNFKGRININLTHPEGKNVEIYFSMLPEFTVKQSLLFVWDAIPEKPVVKKIDVINNYQKDFEIESLTAKGNIIGVKVLKRNKIANGYQLEVEITAPALANKTGFTDKLSINIKGGKELTVTCKGYYPKKTEIEMK